MKKTLLGAALSAALATTLSTNAEAAAIGGVTSNITSVQLWLQNVNLMTAEAPGSFTNLAFGGTVTDLNDDGHVDDANFTFTGEIGFVVAGLDIRMTYNLQNGGFASGSGIAFSEGYTQIDVFTSTSGWIPYATIDATLTPLELLANRPGHWSDLYPAQTTAGIVSETLPGLWNGVAGGAGFNKAAGTFMMFGQTIGFFMEGNLTVGYLEGPYMTLEPPTVPVPAAAWLFGSGLAGLAGAARMRSRRAA